MEASSKIALLSTQNKLDSPLDINNPILWYAVMPKESAHSGVESRLVQGTKLFGLLACTVLLLWLVYAIRSVLFPFILSFLVAYILDPIADRIESVGIPRGAAVGMIFLGIVLIFVLTVIFLVPVFQSQYQSISESLPAYQENLEQKASDLIHKIEQFVPTTLDTAASGPQSPLAIRMNPEEVIGQITAWLQRQGQAILKKIPDLLSNAFDVISFLVIVPFATFFLMKDGHRIKIAMIRLVPNRYFEMSLNLLWRIDQQLGGYIRGQMVEVFAVGVLATIGFAVIGLKYFFVVGALAGITNVVPYLGPTVGFVAAAIVALITDGSMKMVLAAAVVALSVQLIDNTLVQPMVMSRSVDLHPLLIILAVLVGSQLMGVLGMVLAVPVAGIIKVTIQTVHEGVQRFMAS